MRTAAERKLETIEKKLPLDAINPAHESFLRVNSPSHGIFSFASAAWWRDGEEREAKEREVAKVVEERPQLAHNDSRL